MQYVIENEALRVEISSLGAEITSIKNIRDISGMAGAAEGTEYLWQADPTIWGAHGPNLFPYIARMTNETYCYGGKNYHMPIHGFIRFVELQVEKQEKDAISFYYESNPETKEMYPFEFRYSITYQLDGSVLKIENRIENRDTKCMYFGIGGHPGFKVPLEEGLTFEDYRLEFSEESHPSRVMFTPACFLSGKEENYPLENDNSIPLRHDLFDGDAIVLKHAARSVTLCSDKGKRAVRVNYPDYSVIGFWHMPKMEAPYVCIEPWSSLPSRDGVVETISQQSDLISLGAGKTYESHWDIEIR